MRQRVVIAIALACDPKVLIADEPTTALDVTVQAQILELVRGLRQQLGMAIVWITHDLGVAAGIADRIMVMYGGQIVEHATIGELFENPQHPYTRALLESLPGRHRRDERLRSIAGQPPLLRAAPASCSFAARCSHTFDLCRQKNPPLLRVAPAHDAACWLETPEGSSRLGN
jgi:oligopeptide/dipeptide ABC transporter ATP-binding protein